MPEFSWPVCNSSSVLVHVCCSLAAKHICCRVCAKMKKYIKFENVVTYMPVRFSGEKNLQIVPGCSYISKRFWSWILMESVLGYHFVTKLESPSSLLISWEFWFCPACGTSGVPCWQLCPQQWPLSLKLVLFKPDSLPVFPWFATQPLSGQAEHEDPLRKLLLQQQLRTWQGAWLKSNTAGDSTK